MSAAELAPEVVRRMTERGLTLAVVESTTGGLTGHRIVSVPGASKVFVAGVAAYGRRPKTDWLGVDNALIEEHGSVSEATAVEMARGARDALEVTLAIAETGVASPSNNPERPAGLYCLALSAGGYEHVERQMFEGDRVQTMEAAAERLLGLVIEYLDATEQAPPAS
jgi:PncC family amidohydrolase